MTSRIPQVRQILRPPSSCLVNNATLLNAMCDAVEREPAQLPAPAAPTEWPRSFRLPFCVYVVINFLCMFIYDFSCLNLVSVPPTIHFLLPSGTRGLRSVCGLNNIRRHLRIFGGCVRPLRSIYMCLASVLRPLYTLPRSKEACFVLNLPAILNLIWPGHPPFIGACERRVPMNILLHVHYAMHVLYSQPTCLTAQTTGPWKTACDSLAQTSETAQIYGSRILIAPPTNAYTQYK